MTNCTRYLGLDVHAETITAAIAEGRGQIRSLGKFPNRPEAVRKLIERLGGSNRLKVCYEAGRRVTHCIGSSPSSASTARSSHRRSFPRRPVTR